MALYVASASSATGRRHIVYHTRPYSLTDSSWCLPASRVSATDIELPVRSTTSVPISNVSPSPHLRYPLVSKQKESFLPRLLLVSRLELIKKGICRLLILESLVI